MQPKDALHLNALLDSQTFGVHKVRTRLFEEPKEVRLPLWMHFEGFGADKAGLSIAPHLIRMHEPMTQDTAAILLGAGDALKKIHVKCVYDLILSAPSLLCALRFCATNTPNVCAAYPKVQDALHDLRPFGAVDVLNKGSTTLIATTALGDICHIACGDGYQRLPNVYSSALCTQMEEDGTWSAILGVVIEKVRAPLGI